MKKNKKPASNIQGVTSLITEMTVGIIDIVEDMHHTVVHNPFLPSTPIQHLITNIAGVTYKSIRWSTRFFGGGLDKVLERVVPILGDIKTVNEAENLKAVLNGIVGDYLEEKENPLEIKMQFRYNGVTMDLSSQGLDETYPNIKGKILLMVHGSSMADTQWTRKEHNHGETLSKELGMTPIYLFYNTGRHVSINGRELSSLLEKLVQSWPISVEQIIILSHSMGGLVTRSAMYYGQEESNTTWLPCLQKSIFLGTPHHGAPLEKAGNYLDYILESIQYTKPFAKLGKMRSAGVTDLRYGNIIDEDWNTHHRFDIKGDQRFSVPIPPKVECYTIAAVKKKKGKSMASEIIGDGLVSTKSALGQHKDPAKNLAFKKENTFIVHEHSHLDLLSSSVVMEKLREWI